jgi:hypothetical protein
LTQLLVKPCAFQATGDFNVMAHSPVDQLQALDARRPTAATAPPAGLTVCGARRWRMQP